eukprot:TRINITY_DN41561_c0_g1_i1.p1 TRINITY_DN41561_c0_g1~~TRINITY_DN41561_c0_g1_i1.p1  ORF type:complete len:302 (+),score=48.18 TRINITY_DN41561_c0_g1_i1:94-999(+)
MLFAPLGASGRRPAAVIWRLVPTRRYLAHAGQRGLILVDSQRPVDSVAQELALRMATQKDGAHMLAAGRQGVAVAMRAAASHRRQDGKPAVFRLAQVDAGQLQEAGMPPPRNDEASPEEDHESKGRRRGFRFTFLEKYAESVDAAYSTSVAKVLQVGGNSSFLPLAKAVASTVARLPAGKVAAVETLLKGKSKNRWTRVSRLVESVAQAYEWQVNPANNNLMTRPFHCVGEIREVELEELDQSKSNDTPEEGSVREGDVAEAPQVLRVYLIPTSALVHGQAYQEHQKKGSSTEKETPHTNG